MVILIDCDGILTDNTVYYTSKGERSKGFHSRDIRAIRELISRGYDVIILTQSTWPGVKEFSKRTGADVCQAIDKSEWIRDNVKGEYICVCDDASDIEMIKGAADSFAPSDCDPSLLNPMLGVTILKTMGGRGVIAELVTVL